MNWKNWKLTTEHARSSHGQPVLVHEPTGQAFGPGDVIHESGGALLAAVFAQALVAHGRAIQEDVDHFDEPLVAARMLGQRGGSARTERKAAAARANGRKGGRPRKQVSP